MKRSTIDRVILAAGAFAFSTPVGAQITSNEGDGLLNAPYRGTINSLRECSADVAYGEVKTQIEPIVNATITSQNINIWTDEPWDRSVLRMYEGLDASGAEIDLTGTSETSPVMRPRDSDSAKRLSFKAIGTKTLADQTFRIRMTYSSTIGPQDVTRVITVAPIRGSFCDLPGGLSEAFLHGTSILDVQVGAARLTVPVGRIVNAIGNAFENQDAAAGPTTVTEHEVLLPGAAETFWLHDEDHFELNLSNTKKVAWGTPWTGHMVGFWVRDGEVSGPDGTYFESLESQTFDFRPFHNIRPLDHDATHAATQVHTLASKVVTAIADQASSPNVITLEREGGAVIRITTSDGRGWNIEHKAALWLSKIIPDSGNGTRSFEYNAAGRVTHVKDAAGTTMYQFIYVNDGRGDPTILTEEHRRVDGVLQKVIEHQVVSESLHIRKEFTGVGSDFRQFDFAYDTAANLNHRLKSITSYSDLNGTGTAHTTTFTHDIENPDGTMVVTQVDLPDGSKITHEYDAHDDVSMDVVNFGLRTKSTRFAPGGAPNLVTFDIDYELFYLDGPDTRLFNWPRIIKQRDGRGPISEVEFDYERLEPLGSIRNRLLSRTGPTINQGTSGMRIPRIEYTYDSGSFMLMRTDEDYASGLARAVQFTYDELLRMTSQTVDPGAGGENLRTRFLFCDADDTQDRITIDPDRFWTRTQFDNDARVAITERFLNINAGNPNNACIPPTGPFYKVTNTYDVDGRLMQQDVENKDQLGNALIPATIATTFGYDILGRLELQNVDPGGIGAESNFDYNWLDDVEREFDTSGRGTSRTYDGRGLVTEETPLATGEVPDTTLTTTFEYDAMGNLTKTILPAGAEEQRVYDDFDRFTQIKRVPAVGSGDPTYTTAFEYDPANNVTRSTVDEDGTVISDSTSKFDEGGFNFESRQRLVTNVDGAADPLTQRKFDWAGNVIEETSIGDATVSDLVITTEYDDASRVERTLDSAGGETTFVRDDRSNVTQRTVKLNATDSAVTTFTYDALSRTIQVDEPQDGAGGIADRVRDHDSRGNLLRDRIRNNANIAQMTTVFAYDTVGRQTRSAVLASAIAETPADMASVTVDRVVDVEYDADGRVLKRKTYNSNTATALETATTYDDLGRVVRVTDPSGSYTQEAYDGDGRVSMRTLFDGLGSREFTFGYDGHDRITQQTAEGMPDNLLTTFKFDGLDRRTETTDPKGIKTRTDFDLAGRRITNVQDDGGTLERETDFTYNPLSQLITQTATNKTSAGGPLTGQLTTYRYDSLGRATRIVYPDSSDHSNPDACTDCVRITVDLAGRTTQRIDQRSLTTDFAYDDRGLLLTRTTGTDLDTFTYDAVGRITQAERGTTGDADAVSSSVMAYTDLGDLDSETQTIAGGTGRIVDYDHDQAGNRIKLTYPSPGNEVLDYMLTALNQVDTVNLDTAPLLDYDYNGRLLELRRTITDDPGGDMAYETEFGYDSHRRINAISNRFDDSVGEMESVVEYELTHDKNGNPLTQTVTLAMDDFVPDDRAFTVDSLNRLTGTTYLENGQVESTVFDLLGNRESHTNRAGVTTPYVLDNPANEYATIAAQTITYDAAGNLTVDEDLREYDYDERNRLIQVRGSGGTPVLANYTYDALRRRITFEDPVAVVTTRYYYDGQSVIEERDAADARVRYHVNGAQYIDERVMTFEETAVAPAFTYYLTSSNFSIAGSGNADGTAIDRLDYSSTGDFAGGGPGAVSYYHDSDDDIDLDLTDFINFQNCFGETSQACLDVHDFDDEGTSNGVIDLNDYAGFFACSNGPFVTPEQACGIPANYGAPPPSGTFTLHGRPVDILSDGHMLLYVRARYYDPVHGRWLQRDPSGYSDGGNLYESFAGNASANVDPLGTEVWAEARPVKTTLNGVPVWRVDYFLNRNGVNLGIRGLIWRSAVDSQYAGTEYYPVYELGPKSKIIDNLIENRRRIIGDAGFANDIVAMEEQRIRTLGTVAVALPAAAVAAPLGTAAFSTTTIGITTTTVSGNVAATVATGAFSLGIGATAGESLIGGSPGQIARAGAEGFVIGGLLSAPFGLAAPVGTTSALASEGVRLGTVRPSASEAARGEQLLFPFAESTGSYRLGQATRAITGVVRSQAAKSHFLRQLADSGKAPKWMNQWLKQGKLPPGYQVDHIIPVSVGGADLPSNMRLQGIDLHRTHHKYYRPWE